MRRWCQGWRTSGTRAINGTRHNILGMPAIKRVCILFQNNKIHYEILRANASDLNSFVIVSQFRRRKPAPEEYTTDEEDMITYDVEEDEIEPNPDLVEKDGKQYWKGSLLLTPTRSRK
ncbi:hypothetical protein TNCV_1453771 [Trichonephila clavipes]|nr:hypothetical protein TNCV_1453771 [Trichonephila clavipes]